jgi:hypothetical protein
MKNTTMDLGSFLLIWIMTAAFCTAARANSETFVPVACEDSDANCLASKINGSDNIFEEVDLMASPFGFINATVWNQTLASNINIDSAYAYVEWYSDTGFGAQNIYIDYWSGNSWTQCAGPFGESGTEQKSECNLSSLSVYSINSTMIRFRGEDHSGLPNAIAYVDFMHMEINYTEITGAGYLEVALTIPSIELKTNIIQNRTFSINASVTCKHAPCAEVNASARLNVSVESPLEIISEQQGAKPLYIMESPANSTKSCGSLGKNQMCNLSWIINASGDAGTEWKIDALFQSADPMINSNDTGDANISILGCGIDFSLQFGRISFGNLVPNTGQNEAEGNWNDSYNVSINSGSCPIDLYIRGTNLTNSTLGSKISAGNITWSNTTRDYSKSHELAEANILAMQNALPSAILTAWFWLNVPPILAGGYNGSIIFSGALYE